MTKEKTISERLKIYLDEHDMKPGAFAELTGLSKQNVYKWAKGTNPSDPRDYKRLDDFLSGKLESVPRGNEIKKTGITPVLDYRDKYMEQLEAYRKLSEKYMKCLETNSSDWKKAIKVNQDLIFRLYTQLKIEPPQIEKDKLLNGNG